MFILIAYCDIIPRLGNDAERIFLRPGDRGKIGGVLKTLTTCELFVRMTSKVTCKLTSEVPRLLGYQNSVHFNNALFNFVLNSFDEEHQKGKNNGNCQKIRNNY